MPKPSQTVEINNFISGLITEASPTNFPSTASKDEVNFVLNRDGTRNRRLGMDYEDFNEFISSGYDTTEVFDKSVSTFLWENVEDSPDLNFSVIQIGNKVHFFDTSRANPSRDGDLGSITISGDNGESAYSFAAIDGKLIIATGNPDIIAVSYNSVAQTFSSEELRILVRDQWGLEDTYEGVDISIAADASTRPTTLSDAHLYNIRNQSWALTRKNQDNGSGEDPITLWRSSSNTDYPSNSDVVWTGMYFENPKSERLSITQVKRGLEGTIPAPKGYFIIDLLDRGASRASAEALLREQNPELDFIVSAANLPDDRTPGGATTLTEYAGRIFYAGFSGTIEDPDSHSPRLQSYVMFSKLVQASSDLVQCYSEGDPTSRSTNDLVDTDGGFIRISGARRIIKLVNLGPALFVLADNGVWLVRGGSGFGFNATNYEVVKITDFGCLNAQSVVEAGTSLYYWAEDGIYQVATDQFGDYKATNMTEATIQSFYNNILADSRDKAQGIYDKVNRTVRWLYDVSTTSLPTEEAKEIVYDIDLNAWLPYSIKNLETGSPLVQAVFETPSQSVTTEIELVEANGVQVVVNGELVFTEKRLSEPSIRNMKYLAFNVENTADTTFSFAEYNETSWRDWKSVDSVGVDAKATLQTGDETAGTTALDKQIPYLFMHFRRTEDGFVDDGNGDLTPTNPSGCVAQVRWDFSDSNRSNRWGRAFQAYRYPRPYFASGTADDFDTGFELISTRNKIRGRGKSFSLYLETEPDKDCQIVSWAISINGNKIP